MEKLRILVADDNEINRMLITGMLEDKFELVEACDGAQTLAVIQNYHGDIDLLLLDLVMPVMDGLEVLQEMNRQGWIKDIPVIVISAETSASYTRKAFELGAEDYISRPFDPETVSHRIRKAIGLHAEKNHLIDALTEEFNSKERQNDMMIAILSHIVEQRNGESGMHVVHINMITSLLLKELLRRTEEYGISEADIPVISSASSFHDIGKMAIPEEILNKPGRLTPEEFEIMKTHSERGYEMLCETQNFDKDPLFIYTKNICRYHHERWDGRGYPAKLKENEIPIEAQVVSIADVYDALTSERCYKKAFTHEKAVEMILAGECGTFNPLLLDCFVAVSEDIRNLIACEKDLKSGETDRLLSEQVLNRISTSNQSDVSRNIRLLRAEAHRYETFLALTDEAWFEYYSNPEMIKFNSSAAGLLGLPAHIICPSESGEFVARCGKELTATLAGFSALQNGNNFFEKTVTLPDGRTYTLKGKVVRSSVEETDGTVTAYIIGKIVQ